MQDRKKPKYSKITVEGNGSAYVYEKSVMDAYLKQKNNRISELEEICESQYSLLQLPSLLLLSCKC